MKKNFIKYLACALVAVMILGTTAFAATTTTTTYGDGYITVSTQVTGAVGSEQVTYLVHNSPDETIDDAEILYINQKPATDGSATFDYKVAMTDENAASLQSTIIAGSTSGATLATAEDNIDLVKVDNVKNSTDVADAELFTVSKNWLGTQDRATLTIDEKNNQFVWNNGGEDTEYTAPIEMDPAKTYTIKLAPEPVPEEPVITPDEDSEKEEKDENGAVIAKTFYATISNAGLVTEYGVNLNIGDKVIKLPALGNVNGKFAIKVLNEVGEDVLANSTFEYYMIVNAD